MQLFASNWRSDGMSEVTAEAAMGERPPIELLRNASLFLDFDGTLVEIASTPDAVSVGEELRSLLSALSRRLDGRVAILSGRAVDQIRSLVQPLDLVVGGSHGLEIRTLDDGYRASARPASLDRAAAELNALRPRHPGVLVEAKPLGVAVHYRLAPAAEEDCRRIVERLAEEEELAIQRGKMVFELKPAGADKGTALRTIMAEAPFAGSRPIVLGDDITDEAAFSAARALGGHGILVGEARETAATFRLSSVAASLGWLAQAGEALQ